MFKKLSPTALKMAGSELGLFVEKSAVPHRHARYDVDIVRMLRDEAREGGEADGNGE